MPTTVPIPPPPSQLLLMVITEGGKGRGFDLTDEVASLSFSNANPGGDEVCSFTLSRSWFAENPEVGKGDLVRVMAGVDILWQGRIEENDRATGDAETIGVTAYGLNNRLGDTTFREIYIDCDVSKWGDPSTQRRIDVLAGGYDYSKSSVTAGFQDAGINGPAVLIEFSEFAAQIEIAESWYYGGGIDIGRFLFNFIVPKAGGEANNFAFISTNDRTSLYKQTKNYGITAAAEQELSVAEAGYKYVAFQSAYPGAYVGPSGGDTYGYSFPKVLGRHGLIPQGTWPQIGFTANQLIGDIIGRASGVNLRNLGTFNYIIPQLVVDAPTAPRDAVSQVSEFANADYGVWGPESPLDPSTDGYFDYVEKDLSTQHWFAVRSDFEADLSFHSEIATLFDNVDVTYSDENGMSKVVSASIYSADLQTADLSPRTYTLDAGKTTAAGAQLYAEIFLNVFAGFAPARGSGSLLGTLRHYRRGEIPAYYLRADGSNIRIPDILPAETAFALDTTPDRRTTFPIKRVSVDCSGESPKTTIEFDQANDALSILLAQQAAQAALIG